MNLNRSKHASLRMRQRGVTEVLVQVLTWYGRLRYANGAWITDMDKLSIETYLNNHKSPNRQMIEKLRKTYIVEINGELVTVAHKNRSFRKKF